MHFQHTKTNHGAGVFTGLVDLQLKRGGREQHRRGRSHGPARKPVVDLEGYTRFTDSAAATAMSTGAKTYKGAIGVDLDQQPLRHLTETAKELGKATGIVTSVPFSHATPAGFCVHNWSRNNYEAIARDMLYKSDLDVLMGAGHPLFTDDGLQRDVDGDGKPDLLETKYVGGAVVWEDITDDGQVNGADLDDDGTPDLHPKRPWTVVQNAADFAALTRGPAPRRLLGLACSASTLQYGRAGKAEQRQAFDPKFPFNRNVPTLQTMKRGSASSCRGTFRPGLFERRTSKEHGGLADFLNLEPWHLSAPLWPALG